MKKPDFFIVGAPKCGTTSLNGYLYEHPGVFIPERKELHYFGRDLEIERPPFTLDNYLDYFKDASQESTVGEASVWYLYSETAAVEIYEFNPDARIIIMLRNPVDAIYSLHSQMLWGTNEDIEDFEEALDAEAERKQGKRFAETTKFRKALFYSEVFKYTEQVKRYTELFGKERVHIVIFDKFKSDTLKEYSDVCTFLGVDRTYVPDVSVLNPNKHLGNRKLATLMRRPPSILSKIYRSVVPQQLRNALRQTLKKSNTVYAKRKMMSSELRSRLELEFSDEVRALSQELNVDLSLWNTYETD